MKCHGLVHSYTDEEQHGLSAAQRAAMFAKTGNENFKGAKTIRSPGPDAGKTVREDTLKKHEGGSKTRVSPGPDAGKTKVGAPHFTVALPKSNGPAKTQVIPASPVKASTPSASSSKAGKEPKAPKAKAVKSPKASTPKEVKAGKPSATKAAHHKEPDVRGALQSLTGGMKNLSQATATGATSVTKSAQQVAEVGPQGDKKNKHTFRGLTHGYSEDPFAHY